MRAASIAMACLAASVTSGGEAAAFTNTGSGYVVVDSEETSPNAPLYAWDEVSLLGVQPFMANSTNFLLNLPFAFQFMGSTTQNVTLNSNGYINFFFFQPNQAPVATSGNNVPIPATSTFPQQMPNNAIYGFWDDLNPITGQVRWVTLGTAPNRRVVFQWTNVPHVFGASFAQVTFQITLFEFGANCIRFQYGAMNGSSGGGQSATIGIEGAAGSGQGLQYNANGFNPDNNIYEGLAIGFHPVAATTPAWMPFPQEVEDDAVATPATDPEPIDPNGDGEDDERKTRRCALGAGPGSAGAPCLIALAFALALGLVTSRST